MSLIQKIAIVYRPDRPEAISLGQALTSWLKERRHKVYTAPEQKKLEGTLLLKNLNQLSSMDLVVVLGGDGTYLRAVRMLEKNDIPILGVNLGSLGFLTPIKTDELFSSVEDCLKNSYQTESRSMIEVSLYKNSKLVKTFQALNDVVIERGSLSQLINISIECEKDFVSEIKADGLIVSTPTGSTAYNLAAGGPISHPEVSVFIVTPVASHSLSVRPILFPDNRKLTLKLVDKARKSQIAQKHSAHFVVDGNLAANLSIGDRIEVRRSKTNHVMIKNLRKNYFDLLREKLKFNDR